MQIEDSQVVRHATLTGGYHLLVVRAQEISAVTEPGQFIHLRIPGADIQFTLRRPFSVFKAEDGCLSVLYKEVGRGTSMMTGLEKGDRVNAMGPLGNGFPRELNGALPVLVAGGYGVAPLYFLASRLSRVGSVFIGGASSADVLCVDEFNELQWPVNIATEDGSAGTSGMVTDALDRWIKEHLSDEAVVFYACGPTGMLKAVGERAIRADRTAWLSLDKHMGCGVGACLACVQKLHTADGGTRWGRVCKDGPVFEARDIVWE